MSLRGLIRGRREQRAFCVGLPKAGTHSVATMLGSACRTAHEPEPDELLPLIARSRTGDIAVGELRPLFRERVARLDLDLECNHLLASFLPHLIDAFPRARVVLLVRDCRSWIDSMINDQLNLREWEGYPSWQVVYDSYMRRAEPEAFAPEERLLQELNLYPLSHYVRYWREEAEGVRLAVRAGQLLELRTETLADHAGEIAEFVGVPAAQIDLGGSHSYRTSRKHDVLGRIDPEHVTRVLAEA